MTYNICDPKNEINQAFSVSRPAGHHAQCGQVNGFCFFNNVAVAARAAQKKYPHIKKVCIFDWDVHCGDGHAQIFENDPSVLVVSIHRHDGGLFYPMTGHVVNVGKDAGKGFNIYFPYDKPKIKKVPYNATFSLDDLQPEEIVTNIGDRDYIYACNQILFPIIREFEPDLILVSAGFDSASGDQVGEVDVSPVGYAWLTQGLRMIQPKIGVVLEGGYNLDSLQVSSEAVIRTLLSKPDDQKAHQEILKMFGAPPELDSFDKLTKEALVKPRQHFVDVVTSLKKVHQNYWKCLQPKPLPGKNISALPKRTTNATGSRVTKK